MSPNTRTIDRHATCHIVIIFHIMVYAISRSNCFYRKLVNHSKSKNTFKDRRNLLLFSNRPTKRNNCTFVRARTRINSSEEGEFIKVAQVFLFTRQFRAGFYEVARTRSCHICILRGKCLRLFVRLPPSCLKS